jgi:hypothetical protein
MKKALLILSILVIALGAKAQGNLQFNAVKRFSNNSVTVASGANVSAGSITVPANTVWKIESGACINTNGLASVSTYLTIGNQLLYCETSGQIFFHSPPIWLPAGTYSISIYSGYSGSVTLMTSISAIEFNIIP